MLRNSLRIDMPGSSYRVCDFQGKILADGIRFGLHYRPCRACRAVCNLDAEPRQTRTCELQFQDVDTKPFHAVSEPVGHRMSGRFLRIRRKHKRREFYDGADNNPGDTSFEHTAQRMRLLHFV